MSDVKPNRAEFLLGCTLAILLCEIGIPRVHPRPSLEVRLEHAGNSGNNCLAWLPADNRRANMVASRSYRRNVANGAWERTWWRGVRSPDRRAGKDSRNFAGEIGVNPKVETRKLGALFSPSAGSDFENRKGTCRALILPLLRLGSFTSAVFQIRIGDSDISIGLCYDPTGWTTGSVDRFQIPACLRGQLFNYVDCSVRKVAPCRS